MLNFQSSLELEIIITPTRYVYSKVALHSGEDEEKKIEHKKTKEKILSQNKKGGVK